MMKNNRPKPPHYIRKVVDVHSNNGPGLESHVLTLECGHNFASDRPASEWCVCRMCDPVSDYWIEFDSGRKEWIDMHGVGHYDPRMTNNATHGCNGSCGRDDRPWLDFKKEVQ